MTLKTFATKHHLNPMNIYRELRYRYYMYRLLFTIFKQVNAKDGYPQWRTWLECVQVAFARENGRKR